MSRVNTMNTVNAVRRTNAMYTMSSANRYRESGRRNRSSAHTVRIRKAVQRKSRSRFLLIAILCIVAGIMLGMLLSPPQTSEASVSYDVKTRYTSIRVEEGMTLNALAREYNTENVISDREYVEEVQALNNVYDDKIQSGCYLTIPYYEKEMHETL